MLWLKSLLEQQVLLTVKLTAGASSVRQLIRMEARVWFTAPAFSGRENCSAGSPLVAGVSVTHGITVPPNGKQASKKSRMPYSLPPPESPITPTELWIQKLVKLNEKWEKTRLFPRSTSEQFPCQRALLTPPQPWRSHRHRERAQQSVTHALKEKAHFPVLPKGRGGEGWLSQHLSSVSPTSSWPQGGHTTRQSHAILQHLKSGGFHQIAREDCNFITAQYLGSLGGCHQLACSWIHRRALRAYRWGLVLWQPANQMLAEPCWALPGARSREFQTQIYWAPTKLNALFSRESRVQAWSGKSDREIDRACNVHFLGGDFSPETE